MNWITLAVELAQCNPKIPAPAGEEGELDLPTWWLDQSITIETKFYGEALNEAVRQHGALETFTTHRRL